MNQVRVRLSGEWDEALQVLIDGFVNDPGGMAGAISGWKPGEQLNAPR